MTSVTWYFDFISPYSYFELSTLQRLPPETDVVLRPILFAGLLNHWGQKGPVEIPSKRVWTYRACVWWAKQHDLAFRMPAAHPFNPLPYLRLSIAAGNTRHAVSTIFTRLWSTGADPAGPAVLDGLMQSLQIKAGRRSARRAEHQGDGAEPAVSGTGEACAPQSISAGSAWAISCTARGVSTSMRG